MTARLPILTEIDEPAILLSRDYVILDANDAYRAHYGDSVRIGHARCFEASHGYDSPCDENGESCPLRTSLQTKRRTRVFHVHLAPDGPEHVDVALTPILGEDGDVEGFVEVVRPIAEASAQRSGTFIGRSPAFLRVVELIRRAGPSEIPVLLLGESGTGKELAARAVHDSSSRSEGPFVAVECSGLSESLFEAELFGHAKGAFTHAHRDRPGLVEAARGGTLFLDEVGDVPLPLQIKLLRLLESGTYRRVGESETRRGDFRAVFATNQDLDAMVGQDRFRRDLLYRINAFVVDLPPLRQRREDIALIAAAILDGSGRQLSPEALRLLEGYDFPGNVRELKNILERAVLLADDTELLVEHLPARARSLEIIEKTADSSQWPWGEQILSLLEVEKRYLDWVTKRFSGERPALARQLGVSERTLYRKLARLSISEPHQDDDQ